MKIPSFQRITEQDLQQDDLSPLAQILNRPLDTATTALQGNLSFQDNLAGEFRTVEFDGSYPKTVSHSLKTKPTGLFITNYSGDSSLITAAPFILWEIGSNSIKITDVKGISPTSSNKLKLTFFIY